MTPMLRNLLFGIGALALVAGIIVAVLWLRSSSTTRAPVVIDTTAAVIVAARPIAAGSLLRPTDMIWRRLPNALPPGDSFVRGVNSPAELVGSLARRNIAAGEILVPAALLRPMERGFLAATLVPGYRAMTINADARQSASGLVLPGDRVDVILIQDLADTSPAFKAVGETVLTNARVIATGRLMAPKPPPPAAKLGEALNTDTTIPQTITLEVLPNDARRLLVAGDLGKLELVLRPIGEPASLLPDTAAAQVSVWAGDVSNALRMARSRPAVQVAPIAVATPVSPFTPAMGAQPAPAARNPDSNTVLIIRGSKRGEQ